MGQIRVSRQEAVYRMHPEFQTKPVAIGNLCNCPPSRACWTPWRSWSPSWPAPYVVRTHGDLNLNNVIFDPARQSLHFIDLHRSALADCAQDISVFLISNFRLPVSDVAVRRRINTVIGAFSGLCPGFRPQHRRPGLSGSPGPGPGALFVFLHPLRDEQPLSPGRCI